MSMPWSVPFGRWLNEQLLADGESIPRGYGVAWRCVYTRRAYCLPVPLNRIMGVVRNAWIWLKVPVTDYIGDAYHYGHSCGFSDGYNVGVEQGIRLTRIAYETEGTYTDAESQTHDQRH